MSNIPTLSKYATDTSTRESFLLRLYTPTRSTWIGLNPWMHPLPIPTWRTFTFPAGPYEVAWNTAQVCWRYLGGEEVWPFTGGWMPSGFPLMRPDDQPAAIIKAEKKYRELYALRERGLTDILLAKLNYMAGF